MSLTGFQRRRRELEKKAAGEAAKQEVEKQPEPETKKPKKTSKKGGERA